MILHKFKLDLNSHISTLKGPRGARVLGNIVVLEWENGDLKLRPFQFARCVLGYTAFSSVGGSALGGWRRVC